VESGAQRRTPNCRKIFGRFELIVAIWSAALRAAF
jgi:hypothetical protein